MQEYQYTHNGTEIIDWVPCGPGCGKTFKDCIAEAKERGLTWDTDKLPESLESRKQTKLVLMRRLNDLGKWETFKAILDQLPPIVKDAWDLALEIDESDPLFIQHRPALIAALGITEAELSALFAN